MPGELLCLITPFTFIREIVLTFIFFFLMHSPSKSLCLCVSLPLLAPPCLQGWCVITVQLTDEAADDEGVDYFLLFAGSTQRHLTSTLRTDHDTLHALCPGKPNHPQIPAALTSAAERRARGENRLNGGAGHMLRPQFSSPPRPNITAILKS